MHTGERGAYTLISDAPEALRKVAEQFEKDGYSRAHPWYEQDWDVMWSLGYPYHGERPLAPGILRANQFINRYPALPFCAKSSLARLPFDFIPQAFDVPAQTREFVEAYRKHPEKLWVRKNHGHRGVRLTSPHEVELFQRRSPLPIFVQEFVNPPHLIGGRKWDIGVFVLLTFLKPLRLYAYEDIVLRFCPKDFPDQPVSADVGAYVVDDDYTPYWELEAFGPYRQGQHFTAGMLKSYFARHEPELDWEERFHSECLGAVYDIVSTHAEEMLHECGDYPAGQHHFFDLFRFDFVFDAGLNAHLMEVNMSPNLSAIVRPPLDDLFTRLVRDVFRLVGISAGPECCRRKRDDPEFAAAWETANSENWRPLHRGFAGRAAREHSTPGKAATKGPVAVGGVNGGLHAVPIHDSPGIAHLRFSHHGAVVECELPSSKELDALHRRLPPGALPDPEGPADVVYRISTDLRFFRGDELRLRAASIEEALDALVSDLYFQIAWHARTVLFVHAGAVALNGRGILVLGPSRSGKSTLVAALAEAGAKYYSDDYAVLDASGRVHPYIKPTSLENAGANLRPRSGDSHVSQCVPQPAPVGLIVSTRYDPAATRAPRRLSAAQAVLAMLKNSVRSPEIAELAWTTQILAQAAANSFAIASVRGEAGEAIREVLAMQTSALGGLDGEI